MGVFEKKPYREAEVGEWEFKWYFNEKNFDECYLLIQSKSKGFSIRLGARESYDVYGYLLAAAEQGRTEQLHGYIATVYITSNILTQDQGFVDGVTKEINKWHNRRRKVAKAKAKEVTEAEEMASDALMRSAIERGKPMSRRERRKMERKERKEMREILAEDAEVEGENELNKQE